MRQISVEATATILAHELNKADFASKLRLVRLLAKLSQQEVADALGITRYSYSKYENYNMGKGGDFDFAYRYEYKNKRKLESSKMPVPTLIDFINHIKSLNLKVLEDMSLPEFLLTDDYPDEWTAL